MFIHSTDKRSWNLEAPKKQKNKTNMHQTSAKAMKNLATTEK